MMARLDVQLLETGLDAAAAYSAFDRAEGAAGAVVSFSGVVRGEGGKVDHLYLDWYPGMTEASLAEIAEAAAARFDIAALTVLHRCGKVMAGETIVFVAAASAHRRAAFEAADYAMDRLKSEAALWKREAGEGGEHWVEPRTADAKDLKRWI
jgi:molybdopterin synthase catalytic subunit